MTTTPKPANRTGNHDATGRPVRSVARRPPRRPGDHDTARGDRTAEDEVEALDDAAGTDAEDVEAEVPPSSASRRS